LFPLSETVAMVNMDMVGRLRRDESQKSNPSPKDKLIIYGTGTAKSFDGLIEGLNKQHGFLLKKEPGGYGPSDHASFYEKKVPVIFFFTGEHADYHRPSDTADKINVPGMQRVVNLVEEVVRQLADQPERPQYVKVAESTGPRGDMQVPRIGIMPDYGDDQEGVLLSGVRDNGPAAKAGLKEGDRIVEVGGKPVKNLQTYMVLMKGRKKGEPVELGILREGKKMQVKVMIE
jgi:hypothetical protein